MIRSLACFVFASALTAQPPTANPAEAAERIRALEDQLASLTEKLRHAQEDNERLRLQALRLHQLENLIGDERIPEGQPPARPADGTTPFVVMPYSDELLFLVESVTSEGWADRSAEGRRHIDLVIQRVAPAHRSDLADHSDGTWLWKRWQNGPPSQITRHRVRLEGLTPAVAQRWVATLEPRTLGGHRVLRPLTFARVPTAERFDYDGNGGTFVNYRGRLYWYENSVFFIEDGRLQVIGAEAAQQHLRMQAAP